MSHTPLPAARPSTPVTGLPRSLVLLMAAACGLIVANIYYVQPLLPELVREFHSGSRVVGLSVTTTQLGYAAGLVLLVPLGDLVAKRGLIVSLLAAGSAALAVTAAAPAPGVLLVMLAVAGFCSVAINVLMALAGTLAQAHQRGQVIGTMMTGLLLGVLLARTVSGAVDQAAGWRAVYGMAATLMAALALLLRFRLPALPPAPGIAYSRLLASIVSLVRAEPSLRRRMAMGALGFASFQLLWTALPFLLSGPPFRYSTATIGLFGLIGAAGVLCTQVAGRLLDRGAGHLAIAGFALALGVAWLLLAGRDNLVLLIVGIIVLDVGVQGLHVLNQARIYACGPEIKSRVTTAYMTAYFFGGAIGGALGVSLYSYAGWIAVCVAGGVLFALTGLLCAAEHARAQ